MIRSALAAAGRELLATFLCSPCVVCDRELDPSRRVASVCLECWGSLERIAGPKCSSCAIPWNTDQPVESFLCIECAASPGPLDWIDAWGRYDGGLAKVLHALKFRRHDFLAAPLAGLLFDTLSAREDLDFDLVAAVPMHHSRRRDRGFNQAELLARQLAVEASLPFDGRLLTKSEERRTQSHLPREERRANVRGIFRARRRLDDLRVLLVDDVCTTGETLNACASVLLRAGCARVAAIVVARA